MSEEADRTPWHEKKRVRWSIGIFALLLLIAIVVPADEESGEETAETTPVQTSPKTATEPDERAATATSEASGPVVSQGDRRSIEQNLRAAFRAYNEGPAVEASRYVSEAAMNACGGPTAHAFAYSQARRNDPTTRYDIRVTEISPSSEVETSDTSPVRIPQPAYNVTYRYSERADDGSEDTHGNEDDDSWTQVGSKWVMVDDFVVIDPYCEG